MAHANQCDSVPYTHTHSVQVHFGADYRFCNDKRCFTRFLSDVQKKKKKHEQRGKKIIKMRCRTIRSKKPKLSKMQKTDREKTKTLKRPAIIGSRQPPIRPQQLRMQNANRWLFTFSYRVSSISILSELFL